MSDLASLGFNVDTGGLVKGKAALDAMVPSAVKVEQEAAKVGKALTDAGTAADKTNKSLTGVKGAADQAAAGISKTSINFETFFQNLSKNKIQTDAFSGATSGAASEVQHLGGVSSVTTREILTMMREASNGNFTRLAGSASILAQSLNLMKYILSPVGIALAVFMTLTIGIAKALISASNEAAHFNNVLSTTGNYVGLTAQSYNELANSIAASTNTSVSSNRKMISDLVTTNDFTKDQIAGLVTSAQMLAERTGQSADDVLKSFEKMKDGPGEYADELLQKYTGIIDPALVAHVHQLEDVGKTQEAMSALITGLQNGIAKNTVDNTNVMIGGWRRAMNAVSDYYTNLKTWMSKRETWGDAADIQNTNVGMAQWVKDHMPSWMHNEGNDAQINAIIDRNRGGAARARLAQMGQDQASKTATDNARRIREQADAYKWLSDNVGTSFDNLDKFQNHVKQLDEYLARADHNDPRVKAMIANRSAIVEGLRAQDLPQAYKAATAHHRTPKGPKTDAQKFEDIIAGGENDIEKQNAHAAAIQLNAVAAAALEEKQKLLNEANSKGIALTAAMTARIDELSLRYGKAKVAADNAKASFDIFKGADADIAALKAQADMIGLVGRQLAYQTEMTKLLGEAKAKNLPIDTAFMAKATEAANLFADQSNSNAALKSYTDQTTAIQENIANMQAEQAALGQSAEATARLTMAQKLLNDERFRGITYSPEEKAALIDFAGEQAHVQEKLANTRDALSTAKDAAKGFFSDMLSGLQQGKSFWDSFGQAAMNALNKIAQKLLDKLIEKAIDALFSAFGYSSGGVFGGGDHNTSNSSATKFAKGDTFTNSVVDRPTMFAYGGSNLGIMGEAGPEAIMPLKRGSDGSLGVQLQNSASSARPVINAPVTINNDNRVTGAVSSADIVQLQRASAEQTKAQMKRDLPMIIAAYQRDGGTV